MRHGRALLLSLFFALLSACSEEIPLRLQPSVSAQVFDLGTKSERVLSPESESYKQLAQWIASNQAGWSPYFATPPSQGIVVRSGEIKLQFVASSVIAHTRKGVVAKDITPNEYAFLLR
jgi:hypothetical protein